MQNNGIIPVGYALKSQLRKSEILGARNGAPGATCDNMQIFGEKSVSLRAL
ncbi:hypothetical protein A2U01_0058114 [Trifolium medium]|uniref:Uncharacterized protein n=1 Tax=Trifolium medium TaxID=97028 RepID=A0A392RM70_9FABA|nr:hypothetical protein [Trifolium medium]